jgi:hypothetical protein
MIDDHNIQDILIRQLNALDTRLNADYVLYSSAWGWSWSIFREANCLKT